MSTRDLRDSSNHSCGSPASLLIGQVAVLTSVARQIHTIVMRATDQKESVNSIRILYVAVLVALDLSGTAVVRAQAAGGQPGGLRQERRG